MESEAGQLPELGLSGPASASTLPPLLGSGDGEDKFPVLHRVLHHILHRVEFPAAHSHVRLINNRMIGLALLVRCNKDEMYR